MINAKPNCRKFRLPIHGGPVRHPLVDGRLTRIKLCPRLGIGITLWEPLLRLAGELCCRGHKNSIYYSIFQDMSAKSSPTGCPLLPSLCLQKSHLRHVRQEDPEHQKLQTELYVMHFIKGLSLNPNLGIDNRLIIKCSTTNA